MKKVRQTDRMTFTDTLHLKAIEVSRRTDRQTDRITFTDTLHLEAVDVSRRTDRHNLTGRKTDRQKDTHRDSHKLTASRTDRQTDLQGKNFINGCGAIEKRYALWALGTYSRIR